MKNLTKHYNNSNYKFGNHLIVGTVHIPNSELLIIADTKIYT